MENRQTSIPEVVYPREYIEALEKEIEEVREKIASGEQPAFTSVDALFAELEK